MVAWIVLEKIQSVMKILWFSQTFSMAQLFVDSA